MSELALHVFANLEPKIGFLNINALSCAISHWHIGLTGTMESVIGKLNAVLLFKHESFGEGCVR